jgi:hypothetical protein
MQYGKFGYPAGCRRADGELAYPIDVDITPDGEVAVLDFLHSRIQTFTADGAWLSSLDVCGWPWLDQSPQGLAVAPDGLTYVACRSRESSEPSYIEAYGHDGQCVEVSAIGDVGFVNPVFPFHLDLDASGRLHLALPRAVHVYGPRRMSAWRMLVFDNRWLAGVPEVSEVEGTVDLSWHDGPPPGAELGSEFSVRLDRGVFFETGVHRFEVEADGGVRLWVGKRLLVDDWDAEMLNERPEVLLHTGDYRVRLEYNDPGTGGALRFDWHAVGERARTFLPAVSR